MIGPRRAPFRPPVATLPACGTGRGKTGKRIDRSLEHGVNSTSTRAISYSKANLTSPSNCPDGPDHFSSKPFDTLPEYGQALISYLDRNTSLFPVDVQERYFLKAIESECRRIRDRVRSALEDSGYYGGETDWADTVIAERFGILAWTAGF